MAYQSHNNGAVQGQFNFHLIEYVRQHYWSTEFLSMVVHLSDLWGTFAVPELQFCDMIYTVFICSHGNNNYCGCVSHSRVVVGRIR